MGGNNAVTSKQMARFTFVAQTGVGITTLPAVLARDVGHDGWLSLFATGIVAIILGALIGVLLRRFKDLSILDITKLLFGKIAGTLLNILLFSYLLLTAAFLARAFIQFLRITLFPATPPLIMTPIILLPSYYMIWQGMKTASRFKAVTLLAYAMVLIYVILIYKEINLSFIMPVGEAGVIPLLLSTKTSFLAYIGLELIVFFFPEITDKDKALKWHVLAILFSMLFLTLIVFVCTAVFGENFLLNQSVPLFNLWRIFNAPIIERVDLYMITAWFLAMGCCTRAYMMTAYYSLNKILKKEKNKILFFLFILALLIISRIPEDLNNTFEYMGIINFSGMGVVVFLILCLIISMFKKTGVNQNETQA